MSKHTQKDSDSISFDPDTTGNAIRQETASESFAPDLNFSPQTDKQILATPSQKWFASEDDPDLDTLLVQVDDMLTEMTMSKWLAADATSLEMFKS